MHMPSTLPVFKILFPVVQQRRAPAPTGAPAVALLHQPESSLINHEKTISSGRSPKRIRSPSNKQAGGWNSAKSFSDQPLSQGVWTGRGMGGKYERPSSVRAAADVRPPKRVDILAAQYTARIRGCTLYATINLCIVTAYICLRNRTYYKTWCFSTCYILK